MKAIKILLFLFQFFLFNTAFAQEAKIIVNPFSSNEFISAAHREKILLVLKLKEEATQNIFDFAVNNAEWFTEKFFEDRKNKETIEENMKTYLISDERIENFIFFASQYIDYKLKELVAKTLHEKVESITLDSKINKESLLRKHLPTAGEMVEETYRDLEKAGVNSECKNYLLERFQSFTRKYPKTTLTATGFLVIGTIILSSGALPALAISATTAKVALAVFAWIGIVELSALSDKAKYCAELKNSICKRKQEFTVILDTIAGKLFDSVVNSLRDARISVEGENIRYFKP